MKKMTEPAPVRNATPIVTILTLVLLLFNGCSEDPVSEIASDEEPPEIPELNGAEMDVSYFNDQGSNSSPQTDTQLQDSHEFAYMTARTLAITANGLAQGLSQYPAAYIFSETDDDPSGSGNTWTWNYSGEVPLSSDGSATFSFESTMTAVVDEAANEVNWANEVSWDHPETGSLEDFVLLDGSASLDGDWGNWNLYSPETDGPVLEIEYEVTAEDQQTARYAFNSSDEIQQEQMVIDYEQDGVEHLLQITTTENGTQEITEIFWNTDTEAGYINSPDYDNCQWNSERVVTGCGS